MLFRPGGPDPRPAAPDRAARRRRGRAALRRRTHSPESDDSTDGGGTSSRRRLAEGIRRSRRRRRRRLRGPGALDRQPDRPERRGQDDVLQHAHRRLQADGRADHLRRRGCHRQAAARGHRARHRAHVPEHPPLPEHDRARERARRHARAPAREPLQLDPAHAEGAARGARCARAGRASCCATRACGRHVDEPRQPALRRPAPARGRARARDASRSSCSSTSRPPA